MATTVSPNPSALAGASPRKGESPAAIVSAAGKVGLRAKVQRGMTVDDLARSVSEGVPVLCDVGGWKTVVGVGDKSVVVQDPRRGMVRIGKALWTRRWDGSGIVVKCGGKGGKPGPCATNDSDSDRMALGNKLADEEIVALSLGRPGLATRDRPETPEYADSHRVSVENEIVAALGKASYRTPTLIYVPRMKQTRVMSDGEPVVIEPGDDDSVRVSGHGERVSYIYPDDSLEERSVRIRYAIGLKISPEQKKRLRDETKSYKPRIERCGGVGSGVPGPCPQDATETASAGSQASVDEQIDGWADESDVEPERARELAADLKSVVGKMTPAMQERFLASTKQVKFHATLNDLTNQARREGMWIRTGQLVSGLYVKEPNEAKGTLHLSGGGDVGWGEQTSQAVMSHELFHAIDAGHKISNSPEWAAAYKAEIDVDGDPLSAYARKKSNKAEGFAEYGRLFVSDRETARTKFPKCWAALQSHGLIDAGGVSKAYSPQIEKCGGKGSGVPGPCPTNNNDAKQPKKSARFLETENHLKSEAKRLADKENEIWGGVVSTTDRPTGGIWDRPEQKQAEEWVREVMSNGGKRPIVVSYAIATGPRKTTEGASFDDGTDARKVSVQWVESRGVVQISSGNVGRKGRSIEVDPSNQSLDENKDDILWVMGKKPRNTSSEKQFRPRVIKCAD